MSTAAPYSDFGDWLSPMLVKELRQGMRSRVFVVSFLLLQAAMVVLAFVGLTASYFEVPSGATTAFFWTIICAPLLLIMPLTGLNAVGGEAKANTLELIFLTRLTARRIIIGKWVALIAQSLLLVCAVLPYLVLRYFLGGVDLAWELLLLLGLWCASAILSAITVGFSAFQLKILRGLFILAFVFGLQFFGVAYMVGGGGVVRGGGGWIPWLAAVVPALTILAYMLEFGATRIAPAAENHSTPKRLLAVLVLLATVALHFWAPGVVAAAAYITLGNLLQVVCIGALCESARRPAVVYRPFVRLGWAGRVAGRFLYPGWPSGVFYTIAAGAAMFVCWFWSMNTFSLYLPSPSTFATYLKPHFLSNGIVITVLMIGALTMPAALIHTFWPKVRYPLAAFLCLQVACALLYGMAAMLASMKAVDFRPIVSMLPSAGLLAMASHLGKEPNLASHLTGAMIVTAASIALLLWKMWPAWREIRAAEERVKAWEG